MLRASNFSISKLGQDFPKVKNSDYLKVTNVFFTSTLTTY